MTITLTQQSALKTWAAALALGAACGMAQSQTIQLTQPGPSLGLGQYLNNFSGGATSTTSTTWLGAQTLSANGGASTFQAYCIDPKTTVGFPSGSVYTAASLSSFMADVNGYKGQMTTVGGSLGGYTTTMASAGYGYQSSTAVVQTRLENLFKYAYADSLTSATKASAFGFAVWDIMGSSTTSNLSRTSDALRSAGTTTTLNDAAGVDLVSDQIDKLFSALNGTATWASIGLGVATNYIYTVYYDSAALPSGHVSQNFITARAVAEPGSLALAGLALFGILASRRKPKAAF